MANSNLWLLHNEVLVIYFIINQAWAFSLDIMLNVNTSSKCQQPVVCRQNLDNHVWSGSLIISSTDLFALGKSVYSVEESLVLLSSPSSCPQNYFQTQQAGNRDFDMCSVNCSSIFVKQNYVFLKSVYNVSKASRQSIFDALSPRPLWKTILQGIDVIISRDNSKSYILCTSSDEELTAISAILQFQTTKLLFFTLDKVLHLNETLGDIYALLQKKDLNFVIMCSVTCIVKILHQAYQHETMIVKTSTKWIVIPTNGTAADIITTMMQVPKADIVVVDFQKCTKESSSFSLDKFEELQYNKDAPKTYNEWTDYIQQTHAQSSSSVSAHVYISHTSQSDRTIRHIGYISQGGDPTITEELFPGMKYGLHNRTLTVGTLEWPPFVIKRRKNDSVTYSGVCIDLLRELSRALNFSYKIIEPKDQEWGRVLNGKWTGLVGDLAYNTVDLVSAPITILEAREKVMDFTVPYFYVQSGIILKKPDLNTNKWMTLVSPFRYEVHTCILLSLILSTVFLFVLEEINPENTWTNNSMSVRRARYGDILWYHFGALMANGGANLPTTQSGRSVLSCWWLFTVISAAIYSGNLIAFLTDWQEKLPFSTMVEMVEQDTYTWGTVGGSAYITLFQNSNGSVYKKVWRGLQLDPTVTTLDMEVQKNKVLAGDYAYIGDETLMELWRSIDCDLQMLNDPFLLLNYGIGLPNKSAYTSLFSNQVLRLNEMGMPRVWYKHWSSSVQCETSRSAKRVDLLALQSAFYAAAVGVLLALFVLMAEAIYNKKCSEKTQRSMKLRVKQNFNVSHVSSKHRSVGIHICYTRFSTDVMCK